MKEQIEQYRKALKIEKYLLILTGAFLIGMLLFLAFPTSIILAACTLLLSVSLLLLREFDIDLWVLGFFLFAMGSISAWLSSWYLHETVIAFIGMGIFLIALIICALIEEKFKAIRGFLKKGNKYS